MTARTAITIDEELLERIRAYCDKHDIPISSLLRQGARKILEDEDG